MDMALAQRTHRCLEPCPTDPVSNRVISAGGTPVIPHHRHFTRLTGLWRPTGAILSTSTLANQWVQRTLPARLRKLFTDLLAVQWHFLHIHCGTNGPHGKQDYNDHSYRYRWDFWAFALYMQALLCCLTGPGMISGLTGTSQPTAHIQGGISVQEQTDWVPQARGTPDLATARSFPQHAHRCMGFLDRQ